MGKIPHTCPDIDKVIKAIKSAMKSAALGMRAVDTDNDAYDYLKDIEWELDGLERIMEELRSANSQLRDWADGNEEINRELRDAIEELNPDYFNTPEPPKINMHK